jgi:3D (Asp-Asp-Asp) domain-containing protein
MKTFFRGSAVIAATLLSSFVLLSAIPSAAETPGLSPQEPKQDPNQPVRIESKITAGSVAEDSNGSTAVMVATDATSAIANNVVSNLQPAAPPTNYTATAYSLIGKTASGRRVSKGVIAADPSVLPLGTRVRLDAGAYSGEYLVADTGGSVRGKRIDIWTPSGREAVRFGRRSVKLTVLTYGPRRHSARKARVRSTE